MKRMPYFKTTIVIFFVFLNTILLLNIALADDISEGLDAYKNKDYLLAASLFEKSLSEGIYNDEIHYNLGNTYFNQGSIGKAIFHYRKSIQIAPNNIQTKHNLELARKKLNSNFLTKENNNLLYFLSKSKIRTIFIILLSITCFLSAIYPIKKYKLLLYLNSIATLYVGFYLFFTTSNLTSIVVVKDLEVFASSDIESQIIAIKKDGNELTSDLRRENWLRVNLNPDKKGWVLSDSVKILDDL